MKPMEPMSPMSPMKPMAAVKPWWPQDLGQPSSSGSQNGLRYAFFSNSHRLIVDENGQVTTYDSGEHQINGVAQASGSSASFSTPTGAVDLKGLRRLD